VLRCSPYNAHTDRPAVFALAGDVTGLRARGAAEVVGVEGSAKLLRHARDLVGRDTAVTLHHACSCWPNCTACCVPAGHCFCRTNSHRRMTMQTFLGELLDAGFAPERLVEPRAAEFARRVDEERYLKTLQTPFFVAVRMRKNITVGRKA
jgi:hypothetical protein